jgi:hypothetical protein
MLKSSFGGGEMQSYGSHLKAQPERLYFEVTLFPYAEYNFYQGEKMLLTRILSYCSTN